MMSSKRKRNKSASRKKAGGQGPQSAVGKAQLALQKQSDKDARVKQRRIRRFITAAIVLLGLSGVAVVGANAYKKSWAAERDLSVVGNGTPTVVQVHDSSCSLCRQLKSNTEDALRGMGENLQYRIADIATPEGRAMMSKHDVPHVTLLLFNGRGELKRTLRGVKESDELRGEFDELLSAKR